jgi:hypothetical protein
MKIGHLLWPLLVASCTANPASPRTGPGLRTFNFPAEMIAAHNHERIAVGVAPLSWNPALAASAGQYAAALAATGRLQHSPRQARPGQGENLWMGTRGAYSPRQMVGNWASEKAAFRAGLFPAVSRTGNWADVGHYSQMIWPTTTQMGCAIASSPAHDFLVCRYAPAGNVDGRRVP